MAEVRAMLARLGALAADPAAGSDADRIDRIAVLEQLRGAVAAAQHAEIVAFARSQVEAHIADDTLDPKAVGRGIGDQIGLACHVSPFHGSRRLGIARALVLDLPGVHGLLGAGRIREDLAEVVVSETRHLNAELRRLVDKQVCAEGIEALSAHRATALIKRLAYDADRAGYVARGRTARSDRRVGLRPAPDTMSVLTGVLPVEQGVACLAALRKHTDAVMAAGDARTRDQVMADTLVERVTGQTRAEDVNVEVGIVLPVEALLDPERGGAAEVTGYGPIPAPIAHDLLADTNGQRWWRRLFTAPAGLVGADPRRRCFDGVLAHLIRVRDGGRCRDPFCDAPLRHVDHIRPHRAGGPTSLANGRGVCARGNYVREMPGWRVELVHDGHGRDPHTVRTTTPTGHTYVSRAWDPRRNGRGLPAEDRSHRRSGRRAAGRAGIPTGCRHRGRTAEARATGWAPSRPSSSCSGALLSVFPASAGLGFVLCVLAIIPAVVAYQRTRKGTATDRRRSLAAVAMAPTFVVVAVVVGSVTAPLSTGGRRHGGTGAARSCSRRGWVDRCRPPRRPTSAASDAGRSGAAAPAVVGRRHRRGRRRRDRAEPPTRGQSDAATVAARPRSGGEARARSPRRNRAPEPRRRERSVGRGGCDEGHALRERERQLRAPARRRGGRACRGERPVRGRHVLLQPAPAAAPARTRAVSERWLSDLAG